MTVTEDFMEAVEKGKEILDDENNPVDARDLFYCIAESAWLRADPGIIFLDRMNADNPLVDEHPYTSTPPCAERGLAEGELCFFTYINPAALIKNGGIDEEMIQELEKVTDFTTRFADNTVEYSVEYSPTQITKDITEKKRGIAIGVSGMADMLIKMGVPYASEEGRQAVKDVLAVINYQSKVTSVELAKKRGANGATQFGLLDVFNPNRENVAQLIEKRLVANPTTYVSQEQSQAVADDVREYGIRNVPTTALPPAGTVAIFLDTVSQLEPLFNVHNETGDIKKVIEDYVYNVISDKQEAKRILQIAKGKGSFQDIEGFPPELSKVLLTAKEISPEDHIEMVASAVSVYDESASKTVNLPKTATIEDVARTFLLAYKRGLKAVAVYVDGSKWGQPRDL